MIYVTDDSCYGVVLTYYGGAIMHKVKMLRLLVDGSHFAEAMATTKGGEILSTAREIFRAAGIKLNGPTFVGTDNISNALVGSGEGSATRSRHFLRRYYTFMQRVKAGECTLKHIPDAENPADFLTKSYST